MKSFREFLIESVGNINIVLIGPPASGKGTLASFIQKEYDLTTLSAGDVIREKITEDPAFASKHAERIAGGNFLPDDITNQLMIERIRSTPRNYVLDGWPRRILQAIAFEEYLSTVNEKLTHVLSLIVDEQVLYNRSLNRASSSVVKRADDTPQVMINRVSLYKSETVPVINYYRTNGILHEIDGNGTIQQVVESAKRILC